MLRVQVGLGAVRARELAIGILDRNNSALGVASASRSGSRAAGSAGENATATLRADDVCRLVGLAHATGHDTARAVGRVHTGLGHDTTGGHGTQNRRNASRRGGRRDGLRVRRSHRGLGQHGLSAVRLGRGRVLAHLLVRTARLLLLLLLLLRLVRRHVVLGARSVGRRRSARCVRVAAVHLVHGGGGLRLQRRQSLVRQRGVGVLKLMRRDGGGRRVGGRGRVYTIGRVLGSVHAIRGRSVGLLSRQRRTEQLACCEIKTRSHVCLYGTRRGSRVKILWDKDSQVADPVEDVAARAKRSKLECSDAQSRSSSG